jgi:hypothetical protein
MRRLLLTCASVLIPIVAAAQSSTMMSKPNPVVTKVADQYVKATLAGDTAG